MSTGESSAPETEYDDDMGTIRFKWDMGTLTTVKPWFKDHMMEARTLVDEKLEWKFTDAVTDYIDRYMDHLTHWVEFQEQAFTGAPNQDKIMRVPVGLNLDAADELSAFWQRAKPLVEATYPPEPWSKESALTNAEYQRGFDTVIEAIGAVTKIGRAMLANCPVTEPQGAPIRPTFLKFLLDAIPKVCLGHMPETFFRAKYIHNNQIQTCRFTRTANEYPNF